MPLTCADAGDLAAGGAVRILGSDQGDVANGTRPAAVELLKHVIPCGCSGHLFDMTDEGLPLTGTGDLVLDGGLPVAAVFVRITYRSSSGLVG